MGKFCIWRHKAEHFGLGLGRSRVQVSAQWRNAPYNLNQSIWLLNLHCKIVLKKQEVSSRSLRNLPVDPSGLLSLLCFRRRCSFSLLAIYLLPSCIPSTCKGLTTDSGDPVTTVTSLAFKFTVMSPPSLFVTHRNYFTSVAEGSASMTSQVHTYKLQVQPSLEVQMPEKECCGSSSFSRPNYTS